MAKQQVKNLGTGKRKTSIARVAVILGGKDFTVNKKKVSDYFVRGTHLQEAEKPLTISQMKDKVGVVANVKGGGLSGQAGAVRHAISKALLEIDKDLRKLLKPAGLLTRDSRIVERKKYGKKKSRRSPQWSKR